MKNYNNKITIWINEIYNYLFILLNNIKFYDLVDPKNFISSSSSKKNSYALMNVWLLNLRRLIKILQQQKHIENYHFLDVGRGNGLPIIYVAKKFKFKSISGFDFIDEHIEKTKENIKKDLKSEKNNTNIFLDDANKIKLDDKPYFIFMFNPFDNFIMKKFLLNNIDILKKNKSVIGYANYMQLETIKKFTYKKIIKIEKYKLALIFFFFF